MSRSALRRASTQHRPRALVTGGAGFVGSHLVDRLVSDGWGVLVVDDLSTGRRDRLPGGVGLEVADIATDDIAGVVRAGEPDVVFHLAAQASVPASVADPGRDGAVNVEGTRRILEAASAAGVRRFVFVSSGGAIYGEARRAATERSAVRPKSPYGQHKLEAERLVAGSGLAYSIARPSNIYGPGQSVGLEGAVVAALVAQAKEGRALTIDGNGSQTRDFVHVRDVVAALVRLSEPSLPGGVWNVSASARTSISELADLVEAAAGTTLGRVCRPARLGDVRHSAVSSSKLRRLGWQATVSLAEGLRGLLRE